jgi:hypothetical protein
MYRSIDILYPKSVRSSPDMTNLLSANTVYAHKCKQYYDVDGLFVITYGVSSAGRPTS